MKQQIQIIGKVAHVGRGAIVAVPQSVEEHHGRSLREQLLWLLHERIDELVVDFGRTVFCDPSIAGAMERVYARSQARGVRLSFVAALGSPAAQVMHDAGLFRVLGTYAARDHAEKALVGPVVLPAQRDPWMHSLAS